MEAAGEQGATAEQPDIMNDPAFDTNPRSKMKNTEDSDTCRICRGEGTKEEPLFYPCKCSGSIKFVHQNCLMEWLSHSQKKHCELCKTHFHFTKLYSPHMPKSVPFLVFMRQAILHTYKNLLSWSRLQLVIIVWAACLPYGMRMIWRGLFWLGDGGWSTWQREDHQATAAAQEYVDKLAATGTTPASLNQFTSTDAAAPAMASHVANMVPSMLVPISSVADYISGGPLLFRLGRKIIGGMAFKASNESNQASVDMVVQNITARPPNEVRSSLLSNIRFLQQITRYPRLNWMLVDMFEGQIITLSIVVAFILVFLIREWVVQQQPAMAIAAAANEAAQEARAGDGPTVNAPADGEHDNNQSQVALEVEPAAELVENENDEDSVIRRKIPDEILDEERPDVETQSYQRQPTEQDDHKIPRSSIDPLDLVINQTEISFPNEQPLDPNGAEPDTEPTEKYDLNSPLRSRPSMPARAASGHASEIRRILEEKSSTGGRQELESLKIYMDMWTRGEKSLHEVRQLIDQEGQSDELGGVSEAFRRFVKSENESGSADTLSSAADSREPVAEEAGSKKSPRPKLDSDAAMTPSLPLQALERIKVPDSPTIPRIRLNTPREPSNENRPTSPLETLHLDQDSKDQSGSTPQGLRDISNQQLDGCSDLPPSRGSGSEISFELLSHEPEANFTSSGQQAENPFHPDYDGIMPASAPEAEHKPTNAAIAEADIDLETQDKNVVRYTEDVDNLTDTNPSAQEPNEQSDTADSVVQNHEGTVRQGLFNRLIDWFWGAPDADPSYHEAHEADEEHIVEQVDQEAPFVPIAEGRPVFGPEEGPENNPPPAAENPEAVAGPAEAEVDPNGVEAVDDAEDLEGIMELVGMQGPLFGLIQNAIFCSVIVAVSIGLGIWIPYISGKLFLVFLTNPVSLLVKMPLRWIATTADMFVDICVFSAGSSFYWIDTIISFTCRPITRRIPDLTVITEQSSLAAAANNYAESAFDRLVKNLVATSGSFLESDIPTFSIVAHESLYTIEKGITSCMGRFSQAVVHVVNVSTKHELTERATSLVRHANETAAGFGNYAVQRLANVSAAAQALSLDSLLQVNLTIPQRNAPLDSNLAIWNSKDRALAIWLGYVFFGLLGFAYLKISASVRGKGASGRVEGSVADGLYQAGGVLKVVLIISIEMILFPLFCGLLLDMALLPLFGDVALATRLNFGLKAPYTSLFIHWFIGTCYMFHFALFVSMCRKIMRNGVLYFIRDPDDPTFHPVRDVLERNLFTQLRKIIFSALVYGALVMVCLGGVVWGINYTFKDVFPVYWSSNDPVLEFPVDLLFYNFLMPVAVKFFKPSAVLHMTYSWWFRKCARALRLSHFLFGEKREDEEGRHVRRTWRAIFDGLMGDPSKPVTNVEQQRLTDEKDTEAYFLRDGRYVRAPASDQVRMPRGTRTFLEVDENNQRIDKLDDPEQGPHGSKNEQFTQVYVPPFFRLRIAIFIFLIWVFAATTGLCSTVVPLVLGRYIFNKITPSHLRMNDIYAFSIGIYALGGTGLAAVFTYKRYPQIRVYLTTPTTDSRSLFRRVQSRFYRVLRVIYTYSAFTVFLPALFALLIQSYAIIPLHTYFGTITDRHTIHIVQDWTLGVLYIQAIGRLILHYSPSRPAEALRGIVRDGWLDPDTRLATRAFIFPSTVIMLSLLAIPLAIGWAANAFYFRNQDDFAAAMVYRYSAPALLATALMFVGLGLVKRAFNSWRARIRDEVYLIGERLHNLGERRKVGGLRRQGGLM